MPHYYQPLNHMGKRIKKRNDNNVKHVDKT